LFAVLAIKRHVQRVVIEWIGRSPAPRERIVGREHAVDEGDDGEAVLAVVAQRVDLPPDIAVRRHHQIESGATLVRLDIEPVDH
jgi:hypothetical protein